MDLFAEQRAWLATSFSFMNNRELTKPCASAMHADLPPRDDLLWQQVHWLGAIAAAGSLSAAAQRLGVSKAAVSQQLAALERRIGLPLVRRTTRALRLTEAGQQLVDDTSAAFAQIAHSVAALHDMAGAPRGLVRVSAPVALGRQHLAPALVGFLRRYPEIRVELELSDRLVNLAHEGFDLAVRHVAAPPESHVAWKLCASRALLVASAAYLRRRGVPRAPQELAAHDCLAYLRAGAAVWHFERACAGAEAQRVRVTVRGALRANTSEVLREAVLGGLGIALLPDFSVSGRSAHATLRRLLPEWNPVGFFGDAVYAIRPWTPGTPRAVHLLIEHLREQFADGFTASLLS